MNQEQLKHMEKGKGFVAALDQSGGSTPKALALYGIPETAYSGDKEMFDLVHAMRTRIMTAAPFSSEYILGVIMFENTMDRTVEEMPTPDYLWKHKTIVPFLKVDQGLEKPSGGVQMMKAMPDLDALLKRAVDKSIFGTKMRSVIFDAEKTGVDKLVDQQFAVADQIMAMDLVPIIEPEVDIHSPTRAEAEKMLRDALCKHIEALPDDAHIMLKLSLPVEDDFYREFIENRKVVRVFALSGGFSRADAVKLLARNHGMAASFSRALVEGLSINQSCKEFESTLEQSLEAIAEASAT